jgi:single-strand DNA-binding protein
MNFSVFMGRFAADPSRGNNVTNFTLIRNEYAGKDKTTGEAKEELVALRFSAFAGIGETIAEHCRQGDMITVRFSIRNNNYTDNKGIARYEHNFTVDEFEFVMKGPNSKNAE